MIDWEKGFLSDPAAYVRSLAFTIVPIWLAGAALLFFAHQSRCSPVRPTAAAFRGYVIAHVRCRLRLRARQLPRS
ncbi:MAG: hypothetical protein QM760_19975 [Nibricoccus sp.]